MYTKLHMLDTKISSKLCDIRPLCCFCTRVHACNGFKHCVKQIYPTVNMSHYELLHCPYLQIYCTQWLQKQTLLHSTPVNKHTNLKSFLSGMNKVTYFQNKYNSWQRKHAKLLLLFFTLSYKNIVLLTHFKDYDRNKATYPVPFWKIAIHPVYTVILGFQGLPFFFLTLSSSNPSWIALFRVCKICKKGVWVKSWESSDPTAKYLLSQNEEIRMITSLLQNYRKRIAVSVFLHEPAMYTTKCITNEMNKNAVWIKLTFIASQPVYAVVVKNQRWWV